MFGPQLAHLAPADHRLRAQRANLFRDIEVKLRAGQSAESAVLSALM